MFHVKHKRENSDIDIAVLPFIHDNIKMIMISFYYCNYSVGLCIHCADRKKVHYTTATQKSHCQRRFCMGFCL